MDEPGGESDVSSTPSHVVAVALTFVALTYVQCASWSTTLANCVFRHCLVLFSNSHWPTGEFQLGAPDPDLEDQTRRFGTWVGVGLGTWLPWARYLLMVRPLRRWWVTWTSTRTLRRVVWGWFGDDKSKQLRNDEIFICDFCKVSFRHQAQAH